MHRHLTDRRATRPAVRALPFALAGLLLLAGCGVEVTDGAAPGPSSTVPAAGTATSGPTEPAAPRASTATPDPATPDPATPDQATPDPATSDDPTGRGEAPAVTDPDLAAERDDILSKVTTTVACDGTRVLDTDGAYVRVEGPCDLLTVQMDAGVVVADDVTELRVLGTGVTVFTDTLTTLSVSGDINCVYWAGTTPDVTDVGTSNVVARW
ncbi:DUF3060 domain-containing protein [Sanguibacter massiliensis]|uniref:DUF3060 domain-containing protein n=1 Tax=Sanguibacter massiliensis TaxID=1973217 RepID=UPI000C834A22|nr:DUF3060 domain-containing protein [Sanguibacter massiliensis]